MRRKCGEVSFGGLPFIGKADSIYDAIKNALAVKSERKELIHDGMMGSGRFAVGGGAVLCRFGVGHWIKTGRETANRMKGWRVARAGRPKRMAHSAALNRMKRARSFVSFFMMGASFRFMVWICKNSFILV